MPVGIVMLSKVIVILTRPNALCLHREEMVTASKKLPCNHIFHTACLRSWFQRQQTCPTCRLNILRPTPNNAPPRQQNPPQPGPQVPPQPPQAPGVNPIGGMTLYCFLDLLFM